MDDIQPFQWFPSPMSGGIACVVGPCWKREPIPPINWSREWVTTVWDGQSKKERVHALDIASGRLRTLGSLCDLHFLHWGAPSLLERASNTLYISGFNSSFQSFLYHFDLTSFQCRRVVRLPTKPFLVGSIGQRTNTRLVGITPQNKPDEIYVSAFHPDTGKELWKVGLCGFELFQPNSVFVDKQKELLYVIGGNKPRPSKIGVFDLKKKTCKLSPMSVRVQVLGMEPSLARQLVAQLFNDNGTIDIVLLEPSTGRVSKIGQFCDLYASDSSGNLYDPVRQIVGALGRGKHDRALRWYTYSLKTKSCSFVRMNSILKLPLWSH